MGCIYTNVVFVMNTINYVLNKLCICFNFNKYCVYNNNGGIINNSVVPNLFNVRSKFNH